MSRRLPRVTPAEIIRVLAKLGFILVRQSGSHRIYRHPSGARVTVPFHAGRTLHPKLIKSILRDAEIDAERLRELL